MESVLPTVQEFQPTVETVQEEDFDAILFYLPGFRKENLRVQLTSTRNLIISGVRILEQERILSRFRNEFPVSTNVETNKITAIFEGGILYIRQPKLITQSGVQKTEPKPPVEPEMPHMPVDEPQPEKKAQEQAEKIAKPLEQMNERVKQETGSKKAVSENTPDQVAKEKEKSDSVSASEGEKSDNSGGDAKMARNTSEKQASDSIDNAMKKDGEVDDGGKRTLDNYRQSVGGLATKLKKPRKVMNVLVVVLLALVLGIYVTNYFKSWGTEEIAEL